MDDYFAGSTGRQATPATPAAPPYTPPAPPSTPPGWAAPPVHAVPSYPAAPHQAWGTPQVPQQQAWGTPYAPPREGLHPALIAVIAGVGAVVVMGVLAAIAIPVFLNQRDLARSTVVTAPEQVLGMPRLTDPLSAAAESRMQGLPGPGDHVAGVYGTGDVRVVVGAARYHLTPGDQDSYLDAAVAEATSQGVTLADVEEGRLGGTLRCGTSSGAAMTICVFVDGGSYGVVVVTGAVEDPSGTARAAREAFVRRT